jgi:hypothetical protein
MDSLDGHPGSAGRSGAATVARAIQRLTARHVGRGFVPLGLLAVLGVTHGLLRGFRGAVAVIVFFGALASAAIMLAYGVQSVRRVLGRPPGAWAPLFWVASFVPYAYGIYVAFWLGFRRFSMTGFSMPTWELVSSSAFVVLGLLCVRAQWKLSEVHLLAQEMSGLAGSQSGPAVG